jgi:hypothetical protein
MLKEKKKYFFLLSVNTRMYGNHLPAQVSWKMEPIAFETNKVNCGNNQEGNFFFWGGAGFLTKNSNPLSYV